MKKPRKPLPDEAISCIVIIILGLYILYCAYTVELPPTRIRWWHYMDILYWIVN